MPVTTTTTPRGIDTADEENNSSFQLSECSTPQPSSPGTMENMANWPSTPSSGVDCVDLIITPAFPALGVDSRDLKDLPSSSMSSQDTYLTDSDNADERDHLNSGSNTRPTLQRQAGLIGSVSITTRTTSDDTNIQDYTEYLVSISFDPDKLRDELHLLVRKNFHNKLRTFCNSLQGKDVQLHDMLGTESQETALCVAIVKGNLEAAECLVDYGGSKLILQSYKTEEYAGMTALHLAVLKQDAKIIEHMLCYMDKDTKGKALELSGQGKYFRDKSSCNWLPLTLAAGIGNIKIFDLLIKHGANPLRKDKATGNSLCHYLARVARKAPDAACKMLEEILQSKQLRRWYADYKTTKQSDDSQISTLQNLLLKPMNNDRYTPLTYAACLGSTQLAETILNTENVYTFKQWELGYDEFNVYEVSEIDPSVRRDKNMTTVLEAYAFNSSTDNLKLGKIPAVYQMMIHKWDVYKKWFGFWCIYHLMVMVIFTVCANYREPSARFINNDSSSDGNVHLLQTPTHTTILVLECFVLLAALIYAGLEVADLVQLCRGFRRNSTMSWTLVLQMDLFQAILFTFSVSVVMLNVLRYIQPEWQGITYAIAAITGWSFMLFFTRAFQNIGIFTAMMQRMISRELLYFGVVFLTIMVGFGTATFCMFQGTNSSNPQVTTLFRTFYSLFRVLVGLEELDIAGDAGYPWLMRIIFMFFVLISNILLLNVLIAAMNSTYDEMTELKELVWLQMRTRAVLMIERRLLPCMKPRHKLDNNESQWFLGAQEAKKRNPVANVRTATCSYLNL